uniref:Uncharacterized protein n=1 Tax=Moniliophthora roreri TaxID=221103 RepID=A0A0W0FWV9_MONRR
MLKGFYIRLIKWFVVNNQASNEHN